MHPSTRSRRSLATVAFRPPRALGVIVGGAFAVWALVFAAIAARLGYGAPAELKTAVAWLVAVALFLLALVFANWTYAVASLGYSIDRDSLTITWGFRRVVIPIEAIQRMVPGRTLDEPRVEGLNWWGCHVGSAEVKRVGYTLFYSTHTSPEELLYVVTSDESYALTVLDQAGFAEEIQGRAALGAVAPHAQRSAALGVAAFPFWRDRVAIATTSVSATVTIALFGYIFARYPGLPDVIQLNFPALGGVVRVGDKSELLRIAYLGLGAFAANSLLGFFVHARERAAGLWLLASGGMIQGVLLAAAVAAFERS